MIKLVIFDGEGVIYSYKRVMKVFYKQYEKFLKQFDASLQQQEKLWKLLYPKIVRGKLTLREANEVIYKKLGIPKSKVAEWLKQDKAINLKYVELNKGIKTLLLKLRAKGVKVAILSNTVHPLRWRIELFKRLRLVKGKHYDKIFSSNQIGFKKPEPEAYLVVLKYFGVRAEETIFVGHDKKELEGARRVGIRAKSLPLFKQYQNF
jgi:putative hydrolase of the HAD superfamily